MITDDTFKLRPEPVLGPIVLSADATSAAIDLSNSLSNALLISVGVGGITFSDTNKIEIKLTHSVDDTVYDAVGEDDVVLRDGAGTDATVGTGGIVLSLKTAHAAATVARLGYIGNRPYLKVTADFSGTHGTGTPIAVTLLRSRLVLDGAPAEY